jgi:hypothetical protein
MDDRLTCGGVDMAEVSPLSGPRTSSIEWEETNPVGTRFTDDADELEVLVTVSGSGILAFDGQPLRRRDPPAGVTARTVR